MVDAVWRECGVCGKKYLVSKFLTEEPDYNDLWCPNSVEHLKIERRKITATIPQEIKQKIIDTLRKGKSIGEIKDELGMEQDIVCQIICDNISSVSLLNKEAV